MGNLIKIVIGAAGYVPIVITSIQVILSTIRRAKKMSEENNQPGVDMKILADTVVADLKATLGELKDFKGGGVSGAIKNIPDVVHAVEKVAKDIKMSGDQKKELAIEVINRFIDIPLIPESGEAVLIGFVVDAVVAAFNKYGKAWLGKL